MNHGEWMIVAIVAMVLGARIYRDRSGIGNDRRRDAAAAVMARRPEDDLEARRLRDEVRSLKERIAVLERIATDGATRLDREIEALRDRS